jgi:hypothetical protein
MNQVLHLEALKLFAKKQLREYPITREFILEEPTEMTTEHFLSNIRTWLRLLEKEIHQKDQASFR